MALYSILYPFPVGQQFRDTDKTHKHKLTHRFFNNTTHFSYLLLHTIIRGRLMAAPYMLIRTAVGYKNNRRYYNTTCRTLYRYIP